MTAMTYESRIKADEIRMTATEVFEPEPEWLARGGTGWRCTLRGYGRSFTVTMWMGPAHGDRKPDVEEVLECVLSDASLVKEYDGAAEFAQAMGYENGRDADRTWQAATKQTERLQRWLGERFDDWLYETANL